jgi:NADH:ubiquinone oxidoreductase subunit 5 (subunit L)/multisubunit Na+/H+ antiporter MnhA subunit
MMMAIGLSQYNVALMHTVNHAFFKALLFLGAGAVIHSFADQQDVRKMGGLIKFLPFTYSVMLTGSLSLLATPFLTGFYSKDLILELAFGQYSFSGMYAYILGSITAGITAFYSFRLISLVFLTTPQGNKESYLNSHESKLAVIVPLLILAIFSIFFGFIFSDLFVGLGTDFFANSVFTHPNNISIVEAEFSLNPIIKLLPAILSLSGAALAIYLYHIQPILLINLKFNWNWNGNGSEIGKAKGYDNYYAYASNNSNSLYLTPFTNRSSKNSLWPCLCHFLLRGIRGLHKWPGLSCYTNGLSLDRFTGYQRVNSRDINYIGKSLYTFLNGKYFFDTIYNQYFITNGFKLGYTISKEIDRGAIEFLGPFGLSNYFNNTGKNLAKLDTGIITTYSLYITLGLLALLFLVFAPLFFNNLGNLAFNYNTTVPARAWAYLDEFRLFIIYFASALCVLSQANKKE